MVELSIDDLVNLVICQIHERAVIHGPVDRVKLPEGFSGNDAFYNTTCGTITIGKGTHFAHGVKLLTGNHDHTDPTFPIVDEDRSIEVGENCWLCSYCIILGPVKIGNNCIIAAGAVVTKDCEAGWLYGGVPAKKIKKV